MSGSRRQGNAGRLSDDHFGQRRFGQRIRNRRRGFAGLGACGHCRNNHVRKRISPNDPAAWRRVGLRLTTAKYYTPKGRSIQSTGITPDIVVKLQPQTVAKAGEKETKEKEGEVKTGKPSSAKEPPQTQQKSGDDPTHRNGTPPAPLPIDAGGSFTSKDDVQLQKAVELLKSWKIFQIPGARLTVWPLLACMDHLKKLIFRSNKSPAWSA